MKVNELAKRLAGTAGLALNKLVGDRSDGALGILTYHRVAPNLPGLPRPSINVTPENFRQQITGLLDRGFTVWPLSRVLQYHARGHAVPAQTIVLTFDDAFESVYLNAWPVLRELQAPATVFLSTAYLDSRAPFPFDPWGIAHQDRAPAETYRSLTTAQCREMAADGLIELGSHTDTHDDFRGRPDELCRDVQASLEILRTRFGLHDVPFAFPYGRVNDGFAGGPLAVAARTAGVLCALTTECEPVDPQSDPFYWGRINAYDWDTGATLAAKLAGCYGWAPKLQDWLRSAKRHYASRIRRPARRPSSNKTNPATTA